MNVQNPPQLYHIGRVSFLWRCIVHRYSLHRDSEAVFLINLSGIGKTTEEFLRRLKNTAPPDIKIIFYVEGKFFHYDCETTAKVIDQTLSEIFKENGIDIGGYDLYSTSDKHNAFAVYLDLHGYDYRYIDYNGECARKKAHYRSYPENMKAYVDVMNEYKALSCENERITEIIALSEGDHGYSKPSVYFDPLKALSELGDKDKNEIFDLFSVYDYKVTSEKNLLMSSSVQTSTFKDNLQGFYRTYASIADYYLSDRPVVLKPHPAADNPNWNTYFDDVLPGSIPSQFMAESGCMAPNIAAFTSTSGGKMDIETKDFTLEYVREYRITDKLYFVLRHIKSVTDPDFSTELPIKAYLGVCSSLIPGADNGKKTKVRIFNSNSRIEEVLSKQTDDEIIVDLDSNGYASFLPHVKKYFGRVIPMRLKLINNRGDGLKTNDGLVLLFVKDKSLKGLLGEVGYDIHLKHCNEDASYHRLDVENSDDLIKKEMALGKTTIPSKLVGKIIWRLKPSVIHRYIKSQAAPDAKILEAAIKVIHKRNPSDKLIHNEDGTLRTAKEYLEQIHPPSPVEKVEELIVDDTAGIIKNPVEQVKKPVNAIPADIKKIPVDIWGTCVSRDTFELAEKPRFTVKNYIWSMSFISAFSDRYSELPLVDQSEFPDSSSFIRRMRTHEVNKTALNVFDNPSEWIVIDFRSTDYGLEVYSFEDGKELVITGNSRNEVNALLDAHNIKYTSKNVSVRRMDYRKYLDRMVTFLKERYKNIILIEARESLLNLDSEGNEYINSINHRCDVIEQEYMLNAEFMRLTDCYLVKCPEGTLSDDTNKWGPGAVHYVKEYYRYAMDCIEDIVFGEKEGLERRLDIRCMECSRAMYRKRIKMPDDLPADIGLDDLRAMAKTVSNKELCIQIAERMHGFIDDSPGVKIDLFDLLWKINTPESLEKMIALGETHGDSVTLKGKLGRAYHYGKGVPVDLDKAQELLEDAYRQKNTWAVLEMFDIQWLKGDYNEMIDTLKPLVEKKYPAAVGRMARAYRDGKGVPQDLEKAIELYRFSAEKGLVWCKNELDICLKQ